MESKGHTAYGVPRFLCEVDIKIVFSDWDFRKHREKELQPVEQVDPHGYPETDPEQSISEDAAVGGNF